MTHLLPGRPNPLGATAEPAGTNFAVHSDIAEAIAICVFDDAGEETQYWLNEKTGSTHHGYLTDIGPGTRYGLRVEGPWAPKDGLWCNSSKLLIDPYAAAIDGNVEWDRAVYGFEINDPDLPEPRDSAPFMPKCIVVDHAFDWGDDAKPERSWADTVLYETHVKALTKLHPDVPEELRGTYAGVASPAILEHLNDLGVTAVELQPIHQFIHDHALVRHGLRNLWGYQPIGYFAPHHEYAASAAPGDQVVEFKQMVKALHAAGIEVILDVVYNHTGESHHLGPNLAYRGIDNPAYYRLSDEDPRHYLEFSGVGNTLNTEHPAVLRMIADSMRLWVETYRVDGFRFDLATAVARHRMEFDPAGPFLNLVHQDPVLNQVKLIAEPWDVGPGGYRLGGFPVEWRELNDRYRDTVRDYWRGAPATVADFASRITGSSDIFRQGGRRPPTSSINFVTSHDGYTLADLVSYETKHNEANGQHNQDGHNDNRSWNTGVEGPTTDPDVAALRRRRRRSFIATLLMSQGVPMLLGGDELGRTQMGNNNAYAQDNEISWYDWEAADEQFANFVASMVALRRDHPVFRRETWLRGTPVAGNGLEDVAWFTPSGNDMTPGDWRSAGTRAVMIFLNGAGLTRSAPEGGHPVDDSFLLMLNSNVAPIEFRIPGDLGVEGWRQIVDTADAAPAEPHEYHDGAAVIVEPLAMRAFKQAVRL